MLFEILNIVLPVFVVITLGALLRRLGLIDRAFLRQTNRLVYYVCLPMLLFYKIGTADFADNFNGALVVASIASVFLVFLTSYLFATTRLYAPPTRGVFSQGAFRGNLAYIGLAITLNAYGETGLTRAGILMGFLVPVLNLLAIVALLLPHRGTGGHQGTRFWLRQLLYNPLIIASFSGIVWSFLEWPIPTILDRSLHIATGMTLPLALLAIGGGLSLKKIHGDLALAIGATAGKLILLPLVALGLLRLFGVGGIDLGVGILIAGTPAAAANYIMAQELKGDAELAGSIVMVSTLASALTYTAVLFLLKIYGL
jgi:malate permease and related proteins